MKKVNNQQIIQGVVLEFVGHQVGFEIVSHGEGSITMQNNQTETPFDDKIHKLAGDKLK